MFTVRDKRDGIDFKVNNKTKNFSHESRLHYGSSNVLTSRISCDSIRSTIKSKSDVFKL